MVTSWPLLHHTFDDFTVPWSDEPTPVVLLHPGLAGNGTLYRHWVPYLADRYRILRIDARGQGRSPRPAGYEWSLDAFVQDALAVMDHLELERVHWVGASGGGIIGQHAAIEAAERIETLTLLATTARFRAPSQGVAAWLAPLDQGNSADFLRQDVARRFGSGHPERTDWIINEILRTPAQTVAELHRWVVGVDLTDDLPKIECPVLIITGEHDTLTDLSDARLLRERIPNARLHILEGKPHNVGYTHPELVAPIVRRFVDEASDVAHLQSETVKVVTEMVGLTLSDDRLNQLAGTLSDYLAKLGRVREIDPGEGEPATITFDSEAKR